MIQIDLATDGDLEAVRRLRKKVFLDELAIQDATYEDVFHDFFSKNIVLRRGGRIFGGLRLAFSREQQEFYLSYLVLERGDRRHFTGALLIGSVLHLMEVNGIQAVYADAHDSVRSLYLKFGCRVIGEPYYKYGFSCPWLPMQYVRGSNTALERRLVTRARASLDGPRCRWQYSPDIILCENLAQYRECLTALLSTGRLGSHLPHLASREVHPANGGSQRVGDRTATDLGRLVSLGECRSWPSVRRELSPSCADEAPEQAFERHNRRFSDKHHLFVRRGSTAWPLAACYSMLTGKKLIAIADWEEIEEREPGRSALYVLAPGESTAGRLDEIRLRNRSRHWGLLTGSTLPRISLRLLRNYLDFIAPAFLRDRTPAVSLRARSRARLPLSAAAPVDSAHALLAVDEGGPPEQRALDIALSSLGGGLSYGEALLRVNQQVAGDDHQTPFILLGDPCLRAFRRHTREAVPRPSWPPDTNPGFGVHHPAAPSFDEERRSWISQS